MLYYHSVFKLDISTFTKFLGTSLNWNSVDDVEEPDLSCVGVVLLITTEFFWLLIWQS